MVIAGDFHQRKRKLKGTGGVELNTKQYIRLLSGVGKHVVNLSGKEVKMQDIISEHAKRLGFEVRETADHTLQLWYKGKLVATPSKDGIRIEELKHEVGEIYLN